MSDIRYKKGTVITCPECGKEIGTANTDVMIASGSIMTSEQWDGVEGCEPTRCSNDNAPYFKDGKLHTKDGWI